MIIPYISDENGVRGMLDHIHMKLTPFLSIVMAVVNTKSYFPSQNK